MLSIVNVDEVQFESGVQIEVRRGADVRSRYWQMGLDGMFYALEYVAGGRFSQNPGRPDS